MCVIVGEDPPLHAPPPAHPLLDHHCPGEGGGGEEEREVGEGKRRREGEGKRRRR